MILPENIGIVLVEPQSAGNIGSVARAMKNMGLSRLILVNPQTDLTPEAYHLACGADDVLQSHQEFPALLAALAPFTLCIGTSSRSIPWIPTVYQPGEMAEQLAGVGHQRVAVIFGPERTGLTNEHLQFCQWLVTIPSNPGFDSMNLSHAVAIVAYELYRRFFSAGLGRELELACSSELEGFYEHLERCLLEVGFLDTENPKRIMATLRQILNRGLLESRDVQILRGILRQWSWYARKLERYKGQEVNGGGQKGAG
jgi:TrmH family RNA methyltransferase